MSQDQQPDPAPWFIREMRQYGVPGLVMAICMGAIYLLYNDTKEERVVKDKRLELLTENVSTVVKENTAAIIRHSEVIDNLSDKLEK